MSLEVGNKAPEFTLRDQDGNEAPLNKFLDKNLVLLFFPFANTSVCTAEMSYMRDNIKQFDDMNANVIGVSVDSPFALKMWAEKNSFSFPLLSDFNKEVSPKYDSLYDVFAPGKYDYKGVSKRSAFVIGKDGKIKYAEICPTPGHQPDYKAIQDVLKGL
jgi:glutaredoxin-dependent peroxiredoxin